MFVYVYILTDRQTDVYACMHACMHTLIEVCAHISVIRASVDDS